MEHVNEVDLEEEYVLPAEAARVLRVSRSYIYLLLKGRRLAFYNVAIGGRIVPRIAKSDLETFMAEQRVEPRAGVPAKDRKSISRLEE